MSLPDKNVLMPALRELVVEIGPADLTLKLLKARLVEKFPDSNFDGENSKTLLNIVKEVMNEVTKLGGLIFGVAILVDRSNGTINLHKNQYSIVELEVVNYDADSVPNNLKEIPVQKPGSRKTQ